MAADEQGNDVGLVGIPISGAIAIAPEGTDGPSKTEGADADYKLPAAFRRLGLVTQDGGPEFTEERDGDPIQFWQDGYTIPTGLANCTITMTAAETNPLVQELHAGKAPDANGYIEVNAGGHSNRYVLWLEEIFRNGMIRRRIAYTATVESFQQVKSERGAVMGYTIVFRIGVSAKLNNNHYGQWVLNPLAAEALPVLSSVAPASAATGATVTLTGSGLTGATQVRFGSTNAASFEVVSDTEITAVVPGSLGAGSAAVKVLKGTGESASAAFTVTA